MTSGLSQTRWTMGRMVSIEWVEMFPIENIKLGQGGRKGRTLKVMAGEDQVPRWRRVFVCSSERLKIRKTAGARLSFFASSLGIGADTSTSVDLVISDAAVNISSRMSSWLVRFCASPSKGWARSLPPLCCSHSAAKSMSMCSKTAVGYASWTGGSGPAVYLSRALRGVNLPAGTLFLLAAASRQFLVDEGMSMGGRTGMKLFGVAPFPGLARGCGVAGGAVSLMGVRMRRGAGGMGTSVGDMLVREGVSRRRVGVVGEVPRAFFKEVWGGKRGGVSRLGPRIGMRQWAEPGDPVGPAGWRPLGQRWALWRALGAGYSSVGGGQSAPCLWGYFSGGVLMAWGIGRTTGGFLIFAGL